MVVVQIEAKCIFNKLSDMDIPKVPVDTFLNFLDFVVPIAETCMTLRDIAAAQCNWKGLFICAAIAIGGGYLALFGERSPFISTTLLIFFLGVFSGSKIIKKAFSLANDLLYEYTTKSPLIGFLIELLVSAALALLISMFLLPFIQYIIGAVVCFMIHKHLRSNDTYAKMMSDNVILLIFIHVVIFILVAFILTKMLLRAVRIASYSVVGVIYTFIGSCTFLYLFSEGENGMDPVQIIKTGTDKTTLALAVSMLVCLLFQFFTCKTK